MNISNGSMPLKTMPWLSEKSNIYGMWSTLIRIIRSKPSIITTLRRCLLTRLKSSVIYSGPTPWTKGLWSNVSQMTLISRSQSLKGKISSLFSSILWNKPMKRWTLLIMSWLEKWVWLGENARLMKSSPKNKSGVPRKLRCHKEDWLSLKSWRSLILLRLLNMEKC